jgi:hypothetical protein
MHQAGRCGAGITAVVGGGRGFGVAHRMHQAGRCGAGITAVVGGTGLGSEVAQRWWWRRERGGEDTRSRILSM